MPKQKQVGERAWYVLHTYSGYEEAVARNLRQRIESLDMQDKIFNVVVPKEKKIRVRGGKREVIEERIYPGYVLVEMIVDDDSWFVVRNTPRVTGFVGAGTTPTSVSREEIEELFRRMGAKEPEHEVDLRVGDIVRISDGPFKDKDGKVSEVDKEKGRVKVLVSLFGRDTPVDLDFLQMKKI